MCQFGSPHRTDGEVRDPYRNRLLGLWASGVWATPAGAAETNTIICNLQSTTSEFRGSCDVPCLVNALAIDIEGPRPGTSCNTPPRSVPAALKEIALESF
jgi:hypothetical protein